MTRFNAQENYYNKRFSLQFETEYYDLYKKVLKLCQKCIDKSQDRSNTKR